LEKTVLSSRFIFEPPQSQPVGSVLYEEHLKLTDKSHITAFAGYLMPLWYSSISAEHATVRQTVGIFDCTHMGVWEISSTEAAEFLNLVTTNDITGLFVGSAQYSYILDTAGNVLDDIIIYKRAENKFMIVVNAANNLKIKAYLEGLRNNQVVIDMGNPERKLKYSPAVRDMKICCDDADCRVDIALQGPAAKDLIFAIIKDKKIQEVIENLKPFHFIETIMAGAECIISRTGYTGAKTGFELFVHPAKAPQIWNKLLQGGAVPCGLGSRDSLRIEAGLPLYGHELAGPFNISPFEAGYGWAVKLEKEFFIGKSAMQQNSKTYNMKVTRIELPATKGVRPVRQNDTVLDKTGMCIGSVLSCAKVDEKQIALAYISKNTMENAPVGIYYAARNQNQVRQGRKQNIQKEQNLQADITGMVVSRFAKFDVGEKI